MWTSLPLKLKCHTCTCNFRNKLLPTPFNYLKFSIVFPVAFKLHGWTHKPTSAWPIKKFQQKNVMYINPTCSYKLTSLVTSISCYLCRPIFLCINKIQIQEFLIRIEILISIELLPIHRLIFYSMELSSSTL